ncbi:MAG: hypothetical protein J5965_28150, partial [Aeriscardovia sp.]|nr:hypothetical protein [Aeriscardovia sp.]
PLRLFDRPVACLDLLFLRSNLLYSLHFRHSPRRSALKQYGLTTQSANANELPDKFFYADNATFRQIRASNNSCAQGSTVQK